MNRNSDDPRGISPEDLFALISGMCPHEIQLQRVMALLGAIVTRSGGVLTVSHEEVMSLANQGLSIEGSETGIVISVVDPRAEEPKQPTHSAPSTRQ